MAFRGPFLSSSADCWLTQLSDLRSTAISRSVWRQFIPDVSGQLICLALDFLALEDGTDRLLRNYGEEMSPYAAENLTRALSSPPSRRKPEVIQLCCGLLRKYNQFVGPDSSVGIATRYGLDGPAIESRWGRDFPHPSRPALGTTHPPIQWVPDLSWG